METSTEMEEQVAGHLSRVDMGSIFVITAWDRFELFAPRGGQDFIFGEVEGSTVLIPLGKIRLLSGSTPPIQQDLSLEEFLANQRLPVKIRYRIQGQSAACWLLNVMTPWLRISSVSGIAWIPMAAVEFALIEAATDSANRFVGAGKW
jgi:hypothetical protein